MCDTLHLFGAQTIGIRNHGEGITGKRSSGEDIYFKESVLHEA